MAAKEKERKEERKEGIREALPRKLVRYLDLDKVGPRKQSNEQQE